jgi:hypothetical protein
MSELIINGIVFKNADGLRLKLDEVNMIHIEKEFVDFVDGEPCKGRIEICSMHLDDIEYYILREDCIPSMHWNVENGYRSIMDSGEGGDIRDFTLLIQ